MLFPFGDEPDGIASAACFAVFFVTEPCFDEASLAVVTTVFRCIFLGDVPDGIAVVARCAVEQETAFDDVLDLV